MGGEEGGCVWVGAQPLCVGLMAITCDQRGERRHTGSDSEAPLRGSAAAGAASSPLTGGGQETINIYGQIFMSYSFSIYQYE